VSVLPKTAFIDPAGHNRVEVEALLHQAMSLLIEEMTRASARSPLPDPLSTAQLKQWAQIPVRSREASALLDDVRSQLTHSMNAAHPGYMGHMDSIPTTLSVVGDLLVAALNNNMLSVEMSPVFSRLEPLVMQAIAARFGLGPTSGGLMVSGGSLANLQALSVARNVAFDAVRNGVVGLSQQPVFFVSEVAHTSFQKAAMIMGLGSDAAIALRTNVHSQVEPSDLLSKLDQAKAANQAPFAIVATAGTTVTGNIDPIPEMAAVAQAHGLWFHVDAAYGGALAFSDDHRHQLAGIEQADSVTFNPQKWLYVAKTCATVLFKNFEALSHHFRILAPYMGDDTEWPNLGELSVQGTRHPDILKLWLSLQHLGTDGYAEIIHHNYDLTEQFTQAVRARPALELASEPQMNLVCFRVATTKVLPSQWDAINEKLQRYLLGSPNTSASNIALGKVASPRTAQGDVDEDRFCNSIFLSLPRYRKQRWLKAVLLNPHTSSADISQLFERIDQFLLEFV